MASYLSGVKTYAEVKRVCERMRRAGEPEYKITEARSHLSRRVKDHYRRTRDSAAGAQMLEAEKLQEAERAVKALEESYGLPAGSIRGKSRYGDGRCYARRALALILRQRGWTLHEISNYLYRPGAHATVLFWLDNLTTTELERAMDVLKG